jgi:undecaprenyl-phosphate 4-deoxy-4-formamido-L-arabinose transferase
VYNEQDVLPALFTRLYPALDLMGRSYEIVFVNDGSRDRSVALLREQFERRPDVTRVVLFSGNFGQHRAILAGFEHAHGRVVITLDADLQNPPEEIPRLLAELDAGHDYVGTIRQKAPGRRLATLGLAAHQPHARAHDARAHQRPRLHVPRLLPAMSSTP